MIKSRYGIHGGVETLNYLQVTRDIGASQDARGGREEDGEDGEEGVMNTFTEFVFSVHVGLQYFRCSTKESVLIILFG